MSSDFWAGYLSGAIGIIIGNPLDVVKVRLQASLGGAGPATSTRTLNQFENASSLVRGAAAPILGYGALNALLFVAYNRSLMFMDSSIRDPTNPTGVSLSKIWIAGAAGGVASWTVSSPTELIKCRAQLDTRPGISSWTVAKDILRTRGLTGLYFGGVITCARDAIGYGFYFWSYEYCKRLIASDNDDAHQTALKVLLCGGIAGVATWASVYPLDMVKTRLQAQAIAAAPDRQPLIHSQGNTRLLNSYQIAKEAYNSEGLKAFYRGLGVCSLRAFIVNAVQTKMKWA
ncbi:putative mitochondrial carrier protein [Aspergillus clavatus NRRL 1]|uniref:Mitochondrial carrier protein, putative n=1 Tax=Aspergillus clavatus (strain ATCC 1007 / CBS 513.65 / DSM 816 / NCTC 3887 / NRRL 1 / QM 1276 / 107) TaxID=344612 RepID=A1CUD0_ASPCL|nr:mitochondrial carrier protein, putative [Aspergillus clavatus NRRL 1]EAW06917.1 mitochondrial carrier protein, putative [Aspergillus clavatus NRRL 1]